MNLAVSPVYFDHQMINAECDNAFVKHNDGKVPVIRVFGSTPYSQRVCVHIHGVFPYFYFRPSNLLDASFSNIDALSGKLPQIEKSLNTLLHKRRIDRMVKKSNASTAQLPNIQNPQAEHRSKAPSYRVGIKSLEIEIKRPIYGYHPEPVPFIRVNYLNPFDRKSLVELLEEGTILAAPMQTYESHVPFILQFTTDYRVKPMDWMVITHALFRHPLPPTKDADTTDGGSSESMVFTESTIPHDWRWEDHRVDSRGNAQTLKSAAPINTEPQLENLSQILTPGILAKYQTINISPVDKPPECADSDGPSMCHKESTCELEVDCFACNIANAHVESDSRSQETEHSPISQTALASQPSGIFGQELWEEERARRGARGMADEVVATAPSSNTCHREQSGSEKEFWVRFRRLIVAGADASLIDESCAVGIAQLADKEGLVDQGLDEEEEEEEEEAPPMTRPDDDEEEDYNDTQDILSSTHDDISFIAPFPATNTGAVCILHRSEAHSTTVSSPLQTATELVPMGQAEGSAKRSSETSFKESYVESRKHVRSSYLLYDRISDDALGNDATPVPRALLSQSSNLSRSSTSTGMQSISVIRNPNNTTNSANLQIQRLLVAAGLVSETGTQTSPSELLLAPSFTAPTVSVLLSTKHSTAATTFSLGNDGSGSFSIKTSIKKVHFSNPKDVPVPGKERDAYLRERQKEKPVLLLEAIPAFCTGSPWEGAFLCTRSLWRPPDPIRALSLLSPTFASPPPASLLMPLASSLKKFRAAQKAVVFGTSQIATPFTPSTPSSLPSKPVALPGKIPAPSKQLAKSRLTVMSMEIMCTTRGKLRADPQKDEIAVLVYHLDDIVGNAESETRHSSIGVLCLEEFGRPMSTAGGLHAPHLAGKDDAHRRLSRGKKLLGLLSPSIFSQASTSNVALTVDVFSTEAELLLEFISRVTTLDPDIVMGYEIQYTSWGYLIARGRVISAEKGQPTLSHLEQHLSRLPLEKSTVDTCLSPIIPLSASQEEVSQPSQIEAPPHGMSSMQTGQSTDRSSSEAYFEEKESGVVLKGRIVLNIWKRMRAELRSTSYTLQASAATLLSTEAQPFTFPSHTPEQLTRWFRHPSQCLSTILYIQRLASLNMALCDHPTIDLLRRTSESARLYCIDFFSVLTRGSQYRVEAALLQQAHRQGFLCVSPSKAAVKSQAPLKVLPLIMEPQSDYHTDPVLVLDFQSLYPSIIIAHNLCYSTLLAKLRMGTGGGKECEDTLGCVQYPESLAAKHAHFHFAKALDRNAAEQIPNGGNGSNPSDAGVDPLPYISPNGCVFMPAAVKPGVLPSMLQSILSTRLMVKRAMKVHSGKGDAVLRKVLDARQLAIKLLANVTYGYTSASFSGRMPCSALADSIVATGRATLEWAKLEVERSPLFARVGYPPLEVIYGDTDSLFVKANGRSREEAFALGAAIAKHITGLLPQPMELKFEKVYHPCLLVTKKRYVGYSFEKPDQIKPKFDAKGIETVRRDGCGVVRKLAELTVRELFDTSDLSRVRQVLEDGWKRVMAAGTVGGVYIEDLIFAKEVRFGRYRQQHTEPAGAVVIRRKRAADPLLQPPFRWRVPYVVVNGSPNAPLNALVLDPLDVLERGSEKHINSQYYNTKVINPALSRLLALAGCDVMQWFAEMNITRAVSRHIRYDEPVLGKRPLGKDVVSRQAAITQYMSKGDCIVCGRPPLPNSPICDNCGSLENKGYTILHLNTALKEKMVAEDQARNKCRVCAAGNFSSNPAGLQSSSVPSHSHDLFSKGALVGSNACHSVDCTTLYSRSRVVCQIEDLCDALKKL